MTGTRKRWAIAIVGTVAILLLGWYVASPFLSARVIERAIVAEDADRLGEHMDREAIRDGIKDDISAKMIKDMAGGEYDPGALGALVAQSSVIQMAELGSTPGGMIEILRSHAGEKQKLGDLQFRSGYVSPSRFRIRTHYPKGDADGPTLLLKREGLSWKVSRLERPPSPNSAQ